MLLNVFQNEMEFMQIRKNRILGLYGSLLGYCDAIRELLEYIKVSDPESHLIDIWFKKLIVKEQNCEKVLDLFNNLSGNLFKIINFLSYSEVLNAIVHDDDKFHLNLFNDENQNKIKIMDKYNYEIAYFYIDSELIENNILSSEDIKQNGFFHLGEFGEFSYIHFKNKLAKCSMDFEAQAYAENIFALHKPFSAYPLCNDIEYEQIKPVNINVRKICDLNRKYIHEGYNFSVKNDFRDFMFTHRKNIWSLFDINEENYVGFFEDLLNIKKIFSLQGYKCFLKISIINEKQELRIYFHAEQLGLAQGHYFALDSSLIPIMERPIFFHENTTKLPVDKTEFTFANIFTNDFIEYRKLLNY